MIRPYTDADAAGVVRLSLRAWAPVFKSIEQAMDPAVYRVFYPDWQVQQKEAVEAVLADSDQHVWIDERDGTPAGFVAVALHRDHDMGEISMMAVDPDHQGKSVGTALTEFATGWMREAGLSVAMVETGGDPGHAPARRTYEKAGFRMLPIARYFKKL